MLKIETIYQEYKMDLYRYLLSLTHNQTLSEDLMSETFIQAIYSIGKFKGNSTIKTWLFGIARNLWLQSIRREKKHLEFNDLVEIYIGESPLDKIITKEIEIRIHELIFTKDEQTQKIIAMRIDGISYFEISQTLHISENSARVIDFRTKRWLKMSLEQEGLI